MSRYHDPQIQRAFRKAVLRKYDWTCQNPECGRKAGRFEAHHILPLAEGGTNALDNGICYCRGCHIDLHRPERTPDQIAWDTYMAGL